MERSFPTIAGLDFPKGYLSRCARESTGHHALLLHGPQGIGKLALAIAYAKALMGPADQGPGLFGGPSEPSDAFTYDPHHPDVHLVAVGNHPDVVIFSRSRELLADEAREVIERIASSPQRGPKRLLILDGAEQFNATVANLLLKSLEEPPPWGQFILLTSSPEQLLPTIRSRTLPVPCREASLEDLLPALGDHFPEDLVREMAEVAPFVGGRVGDLLRYTLLPGYRHLRIQLLHFFGKVLAAKAGWLFDLESEFAGLFTQWEKLASDEVLPEGADLYDLARWRSDPNTAPDYLNFHPEQEPPPATVRQRLFMGLCGRLALAAFHGDSNWQTPRGRNLLEALRRAPLRLDYNANWSLVLEGVLLESFGYEAGKVGV